MSAPDLRAELDAELGNIRAAFARSRVLTEKLEGPPPPVGRPKHLRLISTDYGILTVAPDLPAGFPAVVADTVLVTADWFVADGANGDVQLFVFDDPRKRWIVVSIKPDTAHYIAEEMRKRVDVPEEPGG